MILPNQLPNQAVLVALVGISSTATNLMPEQLSLLGTTAAEKDIVVDFVLGGRTCTIDCGCQEISRPDSHHVPGVGSH